MNASVYRAPHRDRHGDAVDDEGNPTGLEFIGTATGVIIGGQNWHSRNTRGEIADTTGQIGFPRSGLIPQHGDRVLVQGVMYSVVGKPQWDHDHPWTGTDLGYAWVKVDATIN